MKRLICLAGTRRSILAICVAVVVIALVSWWFLRPRPHLEDWLLIEPGMTPAEVEAILRAPPGFYGASQWEADDLEMTPAKLRLLFGSKSERVHKVLTWSHDDCALLVAFDEDDRVIDRWGINARSPRPSLFRRMTSWLRLDEKQ